MTSLARSRSIDTTRRSRTLSSLCNGYPKGCVRRWYRPIPALAYNGSVTIALPSINPKDNFVAQSVLVKSPVPDLSQSTQVTIVGPKGLICRNRRTSTL